MATSAVALISARGSDYAVVDLRASAGSAVPPVLNRGLRGVVWVLEGRLAVDAGGDRRELGPGDHLALPGDGACGAEALDDVHLACLLSPAAAAGPVVALAQGRPESADDCAALLAAAGLRLVPHRAAALSPRR